MKEFPYKSSFSCIIKPLVSEAKDKYLATASLEQIKKFLPNIDIKSNGDLLPIAFNATVVGRVNKNDDVIDNNTALAIYKNFIYKQINIEHKRSNVVGVILTAGFSEFGTDKSLTEEEVKNKKEPFNITLGGVLWRVVNGELAEFVEESNDPTSENYLGISASWELGFTDYKLITLPEGQKNIETGEIIASEDDVNKFKEHLRALGGDGLIDGKRVYRMPSENITPLGIGLTEKPAADVVGVAINKDMNSIANIEKELEKINDLLKTSITKECIEAAFKSFFQNNISQSNKTNVNEERHNNHMLKSINDITDENLKEIKASNITDLIKNTITEKSKEWEQEKGKLDSELSKASEDYKKISEEYTKLQETLKQVQATVETLQKEKQEREQVEQFNNRMTSIAELFEFDDEARVAIVEEVKSISTDESFEKWLAKAKVLFKGFNKKKPEGKDKACSDCGKTHEGACASIESKASVIDKAIENGVKDKINIPNSSTSSKKSIVEQYAQAFTKDSFEIKIGKR